MAYSDGLSRVFSSSTIAETGPLGDDFRWYVVNTQPHAENRVIRNLQRQGYRVFCPRLRKTVRHARKIKVSLVPLFPSYVFVQIDICSQQWRSVSGTFGVARLIMQGELPQPVPPGIVEVLLDGAGSEGEMAWTSPLNVGQAVRISEGPLSGLLATLEQLDERGRVRVLLQLLGRAVSVSMHRDVLTPAN